MQNFPLARGYSWSEESSTRQAEADIGELVRAMLLSVVLIFLLMGVLFESVILPLSILVTILFALLGAVWSLALFAGKADPMSIIGLVILCGVVVKNGVVLLDYIGRLRQGGMSREAAIREGVRIRMRPIFMTAACSFMGLLPMAVLGDQTEGISYKGLSIAVAGGLAFSTIFTAVAVPLAYTFADDLARWGKALAQRILQAS
jgi:HAE1 family hydrophobic/amphiphilic exporter-1